MFSIVSILASGSKPGGQRNKADVGGLPVSSRYVATCTWTPGHAVWERDRCAGSGSVAQIVMVLVVPFDVLRVLGCPPLFLFCLRFKETQRYVEI